MEKKLLGIERIQALTDATFAVAMTILVLEINIPSGLKTEELSQFFFFYITHSIFIYFISFIVLGVFWIGSQFHHHLILHTDRVSSWLNIFFLMFICLIPFSASFLTHYRHQPVSIIFYSSNLILASIIHLLKLTYAWRKKFVLPSVTQGELKNAKLRIVIPIYIYLLSIALSFISPDIAILLFLIPLAVHIIPEKINRTQTNS